MYYAETIDFLRKQGLILPGSEAAVCRQNTSYSAGSMFGGAIGAAVAMSMAEHYIIAACPQSVRVFNINKDDGMYANSYVEFKRENVKKVAVGGLIGGKNITVVTVDAGRFRYTISNKMKGFSQKDAVTKLAAIIKTNFAKIK